MERLQTERKCLLEERQESNEVTRANKEHAARLEAQREALVQKECQMNEKLTHMNRAQVTRLDACNLYSKCYRYGPFFLSHSY